MDFIFFADGLSVDKNSHPNIIARLEPLTLLSAIAPFTKNIGLAATASTTYSEPYNLARQFASIDQISNGRVAWNIVTTVNANASKNFGVKKHMEHDKRYRRGDEFVKVVEGLWDSWESDAYIGNKKLGNFSIHTNYIN